MRESVNCREDPKVPLVKIEFEIMVECAVLCLVTQSCPTLCDPMGCSPPGFSVHRILQARILRGLPCHPPRGSSQPKNQTRVSCIAGTEELMLLNCGVGKTLHSLLDCKEIQPVQSKGDQPWDFFGRNDAKAETPVLWPPHAKS